MFHVQGYGVYTQRNLGSHISVCMKGISILLSGYCTSGCDAYFFQHIPRQIFNQRETRAPWLVAGLALLTRHRSYGLSTSSAEERDQRYETCPVTLSHSLCHHVKQGADRWLGLVVTETTPWLQFYHGCKYVTVYGMFVLLMHLLAKAAGSRLAAVTIQGLNLT